MSAGARKLQRGLTSRLANGDEDGRWTVFNDLATAVLSPFEDFAYTWFWRLSSERPPSEAGVREIPWSRLEERVAKLGLTNDPIGDDLMELWQRLDSGEDGYVPFWTKRLSETLNPKGLKKDSDLEVDEDGSVNA